MLGGSSLFFLGVVLAGRLRKKPTKATKAKVIKNSSLATHNKTKCRRYRRYTARKTSLPQPRAYPQKAAVMSPNNTTNQANSSQKIYLPHSIIRLIVPKSSITESRPCSQKETSFIS